MDTFYTLKQAANILGVHRLTISRWAKEGKITLIYLPVGNRPRISKSELDRILTPKKDKVD